VKINEKKRLIQISLVLFAIMLFGVFQNFIPEYAGPSLYVAKNGNDITGNGTIATPFRTVQKAIVSANKLLRTKDVSINFLEPEFQLDQPIVLDNTNFSTNGYKLYFVGGAGPITHNKKTILSGGAKFTNGTDAGNLKWKFYVGRNLKFRQLYINGHRGTRARTKVAKI
jgi:hypothetical protein